MQSATTATALKVFKFVETCRVLLQRFNFSIVSADWVCCGVVGLYCVRMKAVSNIVCFYPQWYYEVGWKNCTLFSQTLPCQNIKVYKVKAVSCPLCQHVSWASSYCHSTAAFTHTAHRLQIETKNCTQPCPVVHVRSRYTMYSNSCIALSKFRPPDGSQG